MPNIQISVSILAKMVHYIWKSSGDILVCISGDEGSSKSTLAYHIAAMVQSDFDITKQMAYDAKTGLYLIASLPKETVCLMDENLFYKRDAAKRENKWANKLLQRVRYKKRLYIMCSPRLGDLDEYIRNHRIKLWLRVIERGKAEILTPIKSEIDDPWNLGDERKMRNKNRQGFVTYDKMPEEASLIYDRIKEQGFLDFKTQMDKDLDKAK